MGTFLSCDWGTTNFRLRLIDTNKKEISGEVLSGEGIIEMYNQWMATGQPEKERIDFYKKKIAAAIRRLPGNIDRDMPVIVSGMASSSIGLMELPYQKLPFTWERSGFDIKKITGNEDFQHTLYLVSGFKKDDDIMRGEETLLLGCDPGDDAEKIFIFPGTHSKHVFVKNKKGFDFRTYMTGEIFRLLTEESILRNSVTKGVDGESFAEGFIKGMQENLLHSAFIVRTRQLLQQTGRESNYQYLSGLIIGTELKDLKGRNGPIYLVSNKLIKPGYLTGLKLMGGTSQIYYLDADEMFIRGHSKIADYFL
jgi:2-dehydro-3-deoxygalactonokinase